MPTIVQPGTSNDEALPAPSKGVRFIPVFLAIAYLAVWILTGLAALIVGVMIYPNVNSTISDIGTTWLGLAVASGYAYFGLDTTKKGQS